MLSNNSNHLVSLKASIDLFRTISHMAPPPFLTRISYSSKWSSPLPTSYNSKSKPPSHQTQNLLTSLPPSTKTLTLWIFPTCPSTSKSPQFQLSLCKISSLMTDVWQDRTQIAPCISGLQITQVDGDATKLKVLQHVYLALLAFIRAKGLTVGGVTSAIGTCASSACVRISSLAW